MGPKRKMPSDRQAGECEEAPKAKKPTKDTRAADDGEKRLRRFRERAPSTFDVIYQRATEQRFYVLSRTRSGVADCPEEDVEITGSTGNIYVVTIQQIPTCNCPHALKGNQCKHIIFVMSRVLRAPHNLVYQLALLSSELRQIFANAPPIDHDSSGDGDSAHDPNRKNLEGDCPICFSPFEGAEKTVYCKATCGNNIHRECFERWAATKRRGAAVTCPMCRSPWQGDEDMVKKITNTGRMNGDGYVNVADQLGISGERDESTYHNYGPRFSQGWGWGGYRSSYGYSRRRR
ncbi:hypothetical protein F4808DRAFT_457161 [Astrocystis sublimbata]|nr:hypothetical protein F4808DRAFT_457161 [Astrocystis sublimbata]